MKRFVLIAMLLVLGVAGYAPVAEAQSPETTPVSVELMAFPFEGLYPRGPVAKATALAEAPILLPVTGSESVQLMAFPFEGLSPQAPVTDAPTVSIDLMAFPFEGLYSGGR